MSSAGLLLFYDLFCGLVHGSTGLVHGSTGLVYGSTSVTRKLRAGPTLPAASIVRYSIVCVP